MNFSIEHLRLFPDKIYGGATPGVTIAVNLKKMVRRYVIVLGIIYLPECICAFINHASPIVPKRRFSLVIQSGVEEGLDVVVISVRAARINGAGKPGYFFEGLLCFVSS